MATVNFIPCKSQCRASLRGTMDYVRQDKKCVSDGMKLVSGKDCCAETAYPEFMATKNSYGKAKGVFFYHYTQSFSPEENITPAQAHRAALKLAEHYNGFEVLVATHCDAEHIHSHLVINSVSFADGKKLRQDPRTLERLRHISDGICRDMDLTTLQPYEQKPQAKTINTREYRAAEKGESWKFRLMGTIDQAMQIAQTPADFIALMKRRGYGVRWEAGRKSITYTTPEGQKCRDNKLHEAKYLKDRMELELGFRATQTSQQHERTSIGTAVPARSLRDTESTLGSHDAFVEGQYPSASGERVLSGDAGGIGNLLRGNQQNPAQVDGQSGQSPEGIILTGWEDERAKLRMGQEFGTLVDGPAGAIPEKIMEEPEFSAWSSNDFSGSADDLSTDDFEVEDEGLSMRMSF